MGFSNFIGNEATVRALRESIRANRVPQSLLLAGPQGSGKYTLSLMFAQAVNCLNQPVTDGLPDFCGVCDNCTRIEQAKDLDSRIAEAVEAREGMRDADKKDTRILIQPHPDLLIVPPDPPQLLIKLGQVRQVIHAAYYRPPAEAKHAFFIFTSGSFMKEAANSILKLLEEPPPYATLILTVENPHELLPTIRSRAMLYRLGGVDAAALEKILATRRPELKPRERTLVASLAEGAIGRAVGFNLTDYLESRKDALTLLETSLGNSDLSTLFRMTDTYRGGAEGQQKTILLLRTTMRLLRDITLAHEGALDLARNKDIPDQIVALAENTSLAWIEDAIRGLQQVESGMRRNLLRNLSLDAFATGLMQQKSARV